MTDSIFPLQVWPEGIAQASVPANENALREEALRRPCLGVENSVADPEDGALYIVGDTPADDFVSFAENDLAFARVTDEGTSWYAWAPTSGLRIWMVDGSQKVYVGESTNEWQDVIELTNPMTSEGDLIVGGVSGAPTRLPIGSDGQLLGVSGGALAYVSAGSGDVVGPATSVADRISVFDGTTGELLKDGGKTIAELRAPAIQSVTSSATVTPTFSDDMVKITAQAAALSLANPTGTAIPGLGMVIRIKDNGTARAISYGTQYRAIGITLPTTTVIGKTTYIAMIYNSDDTKWDCIATGAEA